MLDRGSCMRQLGDDFDERHVPCLDPV